MQVMVREDGTALALVHWTFNDGRWRVACAPHVEPNGNWQRTDDARAANCPHCRATERFKKALAEAPPIPGRVF